MMQWSGRHHDGATVRVQGYLWRQRQPTTEWQTLQWYDGDDDNERTFEGSKREREGTFKVKIDIKKYITLTTSVFRQTNAKAKNNINFIKKLMLT